MFTLCPLVFWQMAVAYLCQQSALKLKMEKLGSRLFSTKWSDNLSPSVHPLTPESRSSMAFSREESHVLFVYCVRQVDSVSLK